MANFLQQKYKEKPQIWGSFESVQRSLFKNAEKIGIDSATIKIACPFWKTVKNYTNDQQPYVNGTYFEKNSVVFLGKPNLNEITFTVNNTYYNNFTITINSIINVNTYDWVDLFNIVLSNNNKIAFELKNSKTMAVYNINSEPNIVNIDSSSFVVTNKKLTSVLVSNGSQHSFYHNNKLQGVSTATSTSSFSNLSIGNRPGATLERAIACNVFVLSLFSTALKYSQIASLSDNPYQLWQRQPDVYFSFPVAGGSTYQATCATSWFIRVVSEKQTAWNILNLLSQGSDWKIFKDAALNSSFKILSDTTQESSFKILSDTTQESSYKILYRSIQDSSYMILSKLSQESAWQILLSSLTEQSLAWKILNSEEQETSWQIMLSNILEQSLSWKIFNSETQNYAYNILHNSNAISAWKISISNDANATWNILNEKTVNSTWKIKKDNVIDTTWKIININDIELAYNIKHILENNSEWKIFNTETINSSWSLLSDIIPSALYEFIQSQRITEFIQTERTFLFNQAQRTFIFFK